MPLNDLPKNFPPWIFGFKNNIVETGNHFKDMIFIILSNFEKISKRPCTIKSEDFFGIKDSWYSYIGRSDYSYGNGIFFFYVKSDGWNHNDKGICPFDSGGIRRNYIKTHPPLDSENKKKTFFLSHDRFLNNWNSTFKDYVVNNYSQYSLYIDGSAPDVGQGIKDIIKSTPPNSSQAWTWEGRIEKNKIDEKFKTVAFFATELKRNLLKFEVLNMPTLSLKEKEFIIEWLKKSLIVCQIGTREVDHANITSVNHGI